MGPPTLQDWMGPPISGTKEMWMASFVLIASLFPSLTRSTCWSTASKSRGERRRARRRLASGVAQAYSKRVKHPRCSDQRNPWAPWLGFLRDAAGAQGLGRPSAYVAGSESGPDPATAETRPQGKAAELGMVSPELSRTILQVALDLIPGGSESGPAVQMDHAVQVPGGLATRLVDTPSIHASLPGLSSSILASPRSLTLPGST